MQGIKTAQDKEDKALYEYSHCLIDRMNARDSIRVYYNNVIEKDLRTKIAEYDAIIKTLKNEKK